VLDTSTRRPIGPNSGEPNGDVVIVLTEDNESSAWPACGRSRRRNDHGDEQEGWHITTQQEPESTSENGIKARLPICHEERGCRIQACTAQGHGWLPVRDEVPGCSREVALLRRFAHRDTLALRRVAVAFHDAGSLRISFADAGQHDGPDVLALEP
jgi:hypothetical protein